MDTKKDTSYVMVERFEKFRRNVSISLFVIRVNLLLPKPSWILYGLLSYNSMVFFYHCKVLFSGVLRFTGNFIDGQNNVAALL